MTGSPFGNTALYIEQDNRADAILCDCGHLRDLGEKALTRVRTMFISHTHIDHFIDFDHWLAAWVRLGRDRSELGEVACFGPRGFIRNVEGKLMGYTWNLIECHLHIACTEIHGGQRRTVRFDSDSAFAAGEAILSGGDAIWEDDRLTVHCAQLDHKMPSLAYAVEEKPVQVVDKDALAQSDLGPGSWIREFKEAVAARRPADTVIDTPRGPLPLGTLGPKLLREKRGQKLAFVTDTIYNKQTAPRIEALVRGADFLFIEAAFSHRDLEKARETYHLTARQAGRLAAAAGVKQIELFHFSSRYTDREPELRREALEAMGR